LKFNFYSLCLELGKTPGELMEALTMEDFYEICAFREARSMLEERETAKLRKQVHE